MLLRRLACRRAKSRILASSTEWCNSEGAQRLEPNVLLCSTPWASGSLRGWESRLFLTIAVFPESPGWAVSGVQGKPTKKNVKLCHVS